MEDFRGIAEESFPSFITSSFLGNSGILENVTVSSNLDPPVAVSTLARDRTTTNNRYSGIQESYLVEGRFSIPLESSHSSQSDGEPKQRLQLSFHDDENKSHMETGHVTDTLMRESSLKSEVSQTEDEHIQTAKSFQGQDISDGISAPQDSPVNFCLQSCINNKKLEVVGSDAVTQFEDKMPNSELSQAVLLDDEKLLSLTSFEDFSDGIDDEQFSDDHLKAYFEQLVNPGMIYEDMGGQDILENDFILPLIDYSQEASESVHQDKHLTTSSEVVLNSDICLGIETSKMPIKKNMDLISSVPINDNAAKPAAAVCSSTSEKQTEMDLPQNMVYQNKEGKWVTDLAYYTSFNKEQDLNTSLIDEVNEDFISGSEALALIAQDEKEFNEEHQFMQEENIDTQNTSVTPGDTSLGILFNLNLLRRSLSASEVDKDDPSYLRLSLGEFFAQRSEALGCLGGGNNVKRPSFGYFIRSPEKREPIALLRKSDTPRNLKIEMDNHNLFAGALFESSKAQFNEGSFTLAIEELESSSQDDESDVTLTAEKGEMKDAFLMNSQPRRCTDEVSDSGDSVLRISNIALAISSAAVSTEPSQLASMIKSLSNKTRKKTFKDHHKPRGFPIVSNDLEKSNSSNSFDMEKYLKKTEVSRNGVGLENFSRTDVSNNGDLSLPKEHTTPTIYSVDLVATDLRRMAAEKCTGTLHSENRGNQKSYSTIKSSNPVPTNESNKESTTVSSSAPFPDVGKSEKIHSVSTLSDSYSLGKNSSITSLSLLKEYEEIENNSENQRQTASVSEIKNSKKPETLGKHLVISPEDTDLNDTFLEHGGHGSEGDQHNFRLSTSLLSHSSPSEESETALSGYNLEYLPSTAHHQKPSHKSALSELACSQASVRRLTYLLEHESSCPVSTRDYCLEDDQCSITSELNTTSIGASPTLMEEHIVENLEEKVSFQGSVRVPEELQFRHACCVGIVSQTHLSALNPTDHWLQVNIGVFNVSANGEKVDLSTYPCFIFKNKVIVRPHTREEIKVLFIPSDPGIFRCVFSIASWPFSADADTILQAKALASRVILTAIAETPFIEVETEKKDILDFGDLIYGGWKVLPLKLINRTHTIVPIRLVINANASSWHCFTFSKEPVTTSLEGVPYANVFAQVATSSVINHEMPASYDGQDPEFFIVWVLFHNQKNHICSSDILDLAEEFLGRVDIELDSPNPTPVIKSIKLRARVGIAKIHAPKDLQSMHLFASMASSTKQNLPLKNAGNIDVCLDIRIPDKGNPFSVEPENLFLKAGEECEVTVSFTPKDYKACEQRIMKIFVQPFGPQYEVVLKGEVVSSGNNPLTPGSCCSDIPSVLSNKQFLAWGGIPLGRTQLQKLALRNNSTSMTQHLQLVIRGQDQDCFQLQHSFGSEEQLTSNCEIRIRPKEDVNINVLFAPTRLSCMLAKLEIKQLGIQSQLGIKFTIPLSGYGGTSNLILEDVKKLPDCYMITMNDLYPGKESRVLFSVQNTGSRAAFVKAVCFKDSQKKVLLDPKVMRIFPDKFVLKERTQKHVAIIYNPTDRRSSYRTTTEISTVYFFGGDEISRQQYRRGLLHKPEIIEEKLPKHGLLQNINFAEAFQDELGVTEVNHLPQWPNDIQLFYENMHKIRLSVTGEFRDCISGREFLQPSPKHSLESKSGSEGSGKHSGNTSLDLLPVKGPQDCPCLSQAVITSQDKLASEEIWSVHPEYLTWIAPSPCDMGKTRRFLILNNSVRLLKFELCWPAHCLIVTPQHGIIEPESKLQILVSPNSSLSTNHSLLPWSGLIYIHCDNGQKKIVKVQIKNDLTQEDHPFECWASSPFGILPSAPSVGHVVRPVMQPPSTKVEIRNKIVTFHTTEPGTTSENYLELENHGNTDVTWHLSSLAPPYVKGIDENEDVFRSTYAAFRCTPVSGRLESHKIQKVSITFLPRDRGNYAQSWNVEYHPVKEPHIKNMLRFQLSGQCIQAKSEPEKACSSTDTLIKINYSIRPRRQSISETSAPVPRKIDLTHHGVYAPEDAYLFLPTRVGDSRTLKVNLRNNSFITHMLKFLSPREPFYIRHSKYSLRAQHYINIPVQFRPHAMGTFEALLVIQSDEGKSIAIRLTGEALEKQ